jgi:hypothetical protein
MYTIHREYRKVLNLRWLTYFMTASYLSYFTLVVLSERLSTGSWIYLENKRIVQAGLLLVAGVLAFRKNRSPASLAGAWLLATVGTAPLFPFEEMIEIWRHLPLPLSALLWPAQLSHFFMLPLFFTFFALQPRPLFRSPIGWILIFTPVLGPIGWGVFKLWQRIYFPVASIEVPLLILGLTGAAILFFGFGGLIALAINYRRLSEVTVQRKFRVFVLGSWLGVCGRNFSRPIDIFSGGVVFCLSRL